MVSRSKSALITMRPPKSTSPSPGPSTTPFIAFEYDDRASARVSAPDAEEGEAGAGCAEACVRAVRRAACTLVLLVPRRRVAAGGACGAGRGARLSGARPDRPR